MKKFAISLLLAAMLCPTGAFGAALNSPEPVSGKISVGELLKTGTPVLETVSVEALREAGRPVSGTISVQQLQVQGNSLLPVTITPPPPRMDPDLALESYFERQQHQAAALGSYTATTVIEADLPEAMQHGRYELERDYAAPNVLKFHPLKFEGDGGVKSNVITRLLQSEVDHIAKGEAAKTAISDQNYKFNFKRDDVIDGVLVHVYQVKPREKRIGLFKGQVFLDVSNGALVRTEGEIVKSPSFFVKKVEFVQDYTEVAGFTFPARIHSVAATRIYGKAIVDIQNSSYQPAVVPETTATTVHTAQAN